MAVLRSDERAAFARNTLRVDIKALNDRIKALEIRMAYVENVTPQKSINQD